MNILYLVSPTYEFISDALIVGLTRIGFKYGETLHIYPYKRNLHSTEDYFWCYGLPGIGCIQDVDHLCDLIKNGYFDLAFIGHVFAPTYLHDMYEYIFNYLDNMPCVLIKGIGGSFKEHWPFRDLNFVAKFFAHKWPNDKEFPISFSILEERMAKGPKEFDTFFAGTTADAPRRTAFVDALQSAGYPHIYHGFYNSFLTPYNDMLRKARVTFSFSRRGMYNLGRLWRGAAQGACLFIEDFTGKLEVRDNFTHNENAIFFTDVSDMLAKLEIILADKPKLQAISGAGFEHIREHHLVQHCARYVMDLVTKRL